MVVASRNQRKRTIPRVAPSAWGMPQPFATEEIRIATQRRNAPIKSTRKSKGMNTGFARTNAYKSREISSPFSARILNTVTTAPAKIPVTIPTPSICKKFLYTLLHFLVFVCVCCVIYTNLILSNLPRGITRRTHRSFAKAVYACPVRPPDPLP